MRVKQVRRPVQRDHGLAGPRTALHHQHPGQSGPDDLVLLGLDRRDDLVHPPGAARAERRQQRRLADQRAAFAVSQCFGVQEVVVDPDHGPAVQADVPPACDAERLGGSGPVEHLRDRRPPVDQQRVVVVVEQADAPDVEPFAGGLVDPPETQSALDRRQLRESPGEQLRERFALRPGLIRPGGFLDLNAPEFAVGLFTQHIEPLVHDGHFALLSSDLLLQHPGPRSFLALPEKL